MDDKDFSVAFNILLQATIDAAKNGDTSMASIRKKLAGSENKFIYFNLCNEISKLESIGMEETLAVRRNSLLCKLREL